MIIELEREMLWNEEDRLVPLLLQFFYQNTVKLNLMARRHDDRF